MDKCDIASKPIAEGWVTIDQAAALTGYSAIHIRRLVNQAYVIARKVKRDWFIRWDTLLAYKAWMATLGPQKHNPWRSDLAERGRGRRRNTKQQ